LEDDPVVRATVEVPGSNTAGRRVTDSLQANCHRLRPALSKSLRIYRSHST